MVHTKLWRVWRVWSFVMVLSIALTCLANAVLAKDLQGDGKKPRKTGSSSGTGSTSQPKEIVIRGGFAEGTLSNLGRVIEVRFEQGPSRPPLLTFNQGTIGPLEYGSPEEAVGLEILPEIPYAFSSSGTETVLLVLELIPPTSAPVTTSDPVLEIPADGSDRTFEERMTLDGFAPAFDPDAANFTIVIDGKVLPENIFQPASGAKGFNVEPGHIYQFQVPEGSNLLLLFKNCTP